MAVQVQVQLLLLLLFFFQITISIAAASTPAREAIRVANGGFGINLIHRHYSPRSPFYNPNATSTNLWNSTRHHSIARHHRMKSSLHRLSTSPQTVQPPLTHTGSAYLAEIFIGTPPINSFMLMVDTGSTLIWTQCQPCIECHTQTTGPVYDPINSDSSQIFQCGGAGKPPDQCDQLPGANCTKVGQCEYKETYEDRAFTAGHLVLDTFTLPTTDGRRLTLPEITFGCSNINNGPFFDEESGILGLTTGPLSLASQLGIHNFAHCFVPHSKPDSPDSRLVMGTDAKMLGMSTPMVPHHVGEFGLYYYIELDDISVGAERLNIPPGTFKWSASDEASGLIIDSGTTYTILKPAALVPLVKKLNETVKLPPAEGQEKDPGYCYKGSSEDLGEGLDSIPIVTFHFSGGLDVHLKPINTFLALEEEEVVCLTMVSDSDISVFGNWAQQNMNVGYDLANQLLYISPEDCARP